MNERMIKLVSEMLDILKLESGAGVMKKEEISVSKLAEDLSLMTESTSHKLGVTLRNMLKNHKGLSVQSDFQILRSILEGFVSNAINYSHNGQEVVLDAEEEPGAITIFVKDSGIGIPKDEQKKISERFYRATNAKVFKPDGTGLGMYTALMLAEKIGAKISFESKEGTGSTFYLRVPKKVE